MATRRGPSDLVDPFASLPLGQTLSGERERERDAARQALDAAVLGRPTLPPPSENALRASEQGLRAAATLAALRETPDEARRSADLAAIQRTLAERAEQARQHALREAERAEQARQRTLREAEQRIAADQEAWRRD